MPRDFLRSTFDSLEGEAKFDNSSMQTLDHTLAMFLFVVVGTGILISHAEAHGVLEQDSDLASGGSHRLGLADACRQAPLEVLNTVFVLPVVLRPGADAR